MQTSELNYDGRLPLSRVSLDGSDNIEDLPFSKRAVSMAAMIVTPSIVA
jgi:hypothetical protein